MNEQLSSAIAIYFSDRRGMFWERGEKALFAAYQAAVASELLSRIENLKDRTLSIGNRFRHLGYDAAADAVEEALREERPELSNEAIESLAWYWSYCSR
ncbi:hypothetical protein [Streptomyces bambusae]|uniref:Uncharacterized protein n=1 Tax=Streptomyces bambusae TaxID=1550616 RepID=A0ABS6Z6H0_9ACTN|nr:hypothetical protein [Streptomyces bambusae]MBW5482301.1 hypothetical protein [Streptomyces bambusae]